MKSILTLAFMFLSLNSFAEIRKEFDENSERKCHQEAKSLGCVSSDKENQACVEQNKTKLTAACQSLYEAKKAQ